MIGRRALLRFLPVTPLAAKVAADKAVGELSGMMVSGAEGLGAAGVPVGQPGNASEVAPDIRRSRIADFWKRFGGLPDWEVERIQRDARHVYCLDPDIAALRSFSMNAKICMQRERNVQREIERVQGQTAYEELRDNFRKKHGFWFWW